MYSSQRLTHEATKHMSSTQFPPSDTVNTQFEDSRIEATSSSLPPIWLFIHNTYIYHTTFLGHNAKAIAGLEHYIKSKLKVEKTLARENNEYNLFIDRQAKLADWIEI